MRDYTSATLLQYIPYDFPHMGELQFLQEGLLMKSEHFQRNVRKAQGMQGQLTHSFPDGFYMQRLVKTPSALKGELAFSSRIKRKQKKKERRSSCLKGTRCPAFTSQVSSWKMKPPSRNWFQYTKSSCSTRRIVNASFFKKTSNDVR